jgi:polyhydroxybutyrate depolymerase
MKTMTIIRWTPSRRARRLRASASRGFSLGDALTHRSSTWCSILIGALSLGGCGRGDAQKDAEPGGSLSGSTGGNGLGETGTGGSNGELSASGGSTGSGGNTSSGGGTGSGSGGGTGIPLVRPPTRSTGCGSDAPYYGEKTFNIELPGPQGKPTVREYRVMAPQQADYSSDKPYPVVFVFHGANGNAAEFDGSIHYADGGNAGKNAIIVSPQGILLPGYETYGLGWDESCQGYDMPFFDAMLEQVAADFCVDGERVFAAGFSWGGDMVNSLGCCRGDVVRGVLPASAGEMLTDNTGECTSKISAFRIAYSDNDQAYSQQEFGGIIDYYQKAHGCSDGTIPGPAPGVSTEGAKGSCKTYQGCAAPVIECLYPGMGHAKPELWREDVWNFVKQF